LIWLQRILGAALGIALFVVLFVFAGALLAVAAGVALGVWAWLAWKTRKLRREMERSQGTVVEGEYRVERETRRLDDDDPR
jgi:hypothetical protein